VVYKDKVVALTQSSVFLLEVGVSEPLFQLVVKVIFQLVDVLNSLLVTKFWDFHLVQRCRSRRCNVIDCYSTSSTCHWTLLACTYGSFWRLNLRSSYLIRAWLSTINIGNQSVSTRNS